MTAVNAWCLVCFVGKTTSVGPGVDFNPQTGIRDVALSSVKQFRSPHKKQTN